MKNMTPKQIKENRIKLGLSQIEVAVAVGVSYPTFRLWEKGGTKPNAENAEKLAEVLTCKDRESENG